MLREGSLSQRRLLRNTQKAFKKASAKDPDFIRASSDPKHVAAIQRSVNARDTKMDRKRLYHTKIDLNKVGTEKNTRLNRAFGSKSHTDKGKPESRHKDTPEQKFKRQEVLKSRLKMKKVNEERAIKWNSGPLLSEPKKGKGRISMASKSNIFKDKYRGKNKRLDANLTGKKPVKAQAEFKKADSKNRLMRSSSAKVSAEIAGKQQFKRGRKTKLARRLFAGESEKRQFKLGKLTK